MTVHSSRPEPVSNRTVALGAVSLVVVLLLGILIVALSGDDTPAGSPKTAAPITTPDGSMVPVGADPPSIIPRPNEGTGPVEAGDPGGAAQLALFGLLILSVTGIGFVIFRGGKKTRANRALWLAAAEQPEPLATSPIPESTDGPATASVDDADHPADTTNV